MNLMDEGENGRPWGAGKETIAVLNAVGFYDRNVSAEEMQRNVEEWKRGPDAKEGRQVSMRKG